MAPGDGSNELKKLVKSPAKCGAMQPKVPSDQKENHIALKAEKKLLAQSRKTLDASKIERQNKLRCLQYEASIQRQRIDVSELTTSKTKT